MKLLNTDTFYALTTTAAAPQSVVLCVFGETNVLDVC